MVSLHACVQMFVFGTKALEQFVDRMIEWPQYCNHILQISHLRVSHSELVGSIELALARISAAHSEPDAVASEQHGSVQSSPLNMEVDDDLNLISLFVFILFLLINK